MDSGFDDRSVTSETSRQPAMASNDHISQHALDRRLLVRKGDWQETRLRSCSIWLRSRPRPRCRSLGDGNSAYPGGLIGFLSERKRERSTWSSY